MAHPDTPNRTAVIAVFTVIETGALAVWLRFARGEPTVSIAVAIGLGVLAVGLVVEHLLTDVAVNGFDLAFPFGAIVGLSIAETVLWGIWLAVAESIGGIGGFAVAFVILALLLVPQHTIEDNILQGRDLLGDLLDVNTAGFSLVEAAGATVWLALVLRPDLVGGSLAGIDASLVGLGILAIALFVEHNMGVRYSSR